MKVKSRIAVVRILQALCLSLFMQVLYAQDITRVNTRDHAGEPARKMGIKDDGTIRIGLLLEDSLSLEARQGAEMAAKEINEKGGLRGRELKLLFRSMEGPWGQGSKQAVDLIFDHEVWALIGANQGRNAHLVEQVIAKTSVVFLSAWTADPTLAKAYVPHFFNCVPNSEQQGETILEDLIDSRGLSEWVLISDQGYDSQKAVQGILSRESCKENPPLKHLSCQSSDDFESIGQNLSDLGAKAAIVFCEPSIAWELIRYIRSESIEIPLYGSLALLDRKALETVDQAYFRQVYLPGNGNLEFSGARAAYVYDAVRLLADAIVSSGFERGKLRSVVSETRHDGRTGRIEFDSLGNRRGLPELIELDGKKFFTRKP